MHVKKLAVIGAVVGLLGGVATVVPAMADDPLMTSYSISPSKVRSGEDYVTTINGISTDGEYSFTGCAGETSWGTTEYSQISMGFGYEDSGTSTGENMNAFDLVYKLEGWADTTCGANATRPSGTPDWSSGVTITPQLVVDPVVLTVGVSAAGARAYTDKSSTGWSPFDWSLGSQFTAENDGDCELSLESTGISLPAGITVDETWGEDNVPAVLSFEGTPTVAEIGTYRTCVNLSDGNGNAAYAWVDIVVEEAKLPDTGLSQATVALTAGVAGLMVLLGAGLVFRRRLGRK